jgi:arginine repressor
MVWLRQRGESQAHIVKKVFEKYGIKVSQGTVSNLLKTKKA